MSSAVDDAARHDVRGDQLDQRAQQPRDVAEPFGELAAIEIEAAARVDLGLPIERKMVAELGDRDVGEEARHRPCRAGSAAPASAPAPWLALAARAGRAHVADHLEAAGDVVEHLGDALADRAQLGAAAGLADVRRHVHDVAARQLGRAAGGASSSRRCVSSAGGASASRRLRLGRLRLRCERPRPSPPRPPPAPARAGR